MEYHYTKEDLLHRLPKRKKDSYKGSYGSVLVIAGSKNMSGAAFLAGKAAYRSGAGLVYIYTEECNRIIMQTLLPEAVLITYEEKTWCEAHLESAMAHKQSVVFGPGLGQSDIKRRMLEVVLAHSEIKRIIDADGLNLLAGAGMLPAKEPYIVTPHLGELRRLTGCTNEEIKKDLTAFASSFAKKNHVIAVIKDANTRVSDGSDDVYVNHTGNHGMATGGSGDVLSGVIGGLLAQGMTLYEAAKLGVYIHGLAGDMARKERGSYAMMAGDIADHILYGIEGESDE